MSTVLARNIESPDGGFPDGLLSVLPVAWVHFNMATGEIVASYNVASITDNATGNFTINFENALDSANYCPVESAGTTGITTSSNVRSLSFINMTTTSVDVINTLSNTTASDASVCCVVIFGGQS